VPEAVSGAAYRIVQESLTNVLRHAPGAATEVGLERSGDALVVRVANAPTGQASHDIDEGSGLTGMRTRAAAVGGELTAGPGPAGGWVVRAVLPLTRVEAAP
jgi:signal transduction histidine kinase